MHDRNAAGFQTLCGEYGQAVRVIGGLPASGRVEDILEQKSLRNV